MIYRQGRCLLARESVSERALEIRRWHRSVICISRPHDAPAVAAHFCLAHLACKTSCIYEPDDGCLQKRESNRTHHLANCQNIVESHVIL